MLAARHDNCSDKSGHIDWIFRGWQHSNLAQLELFHFLPGKMVDGMKQLRMCMDQDYYVSDGHNNH